MRAKPPKPRKCKVCKAQYTPTKPMQTVCGIGCAKALAQSARVKAERRKAIQERRDTRARLESIKPRAKWMAECQEIANRYARVRDAKDGCISCDRPASWNGQWHGSHFRSVGAASAVRLNLWNIHKACSICNHHLSGNIAEYELRLIAKIGAEKVEWLKAQNQLVRHDIEYLKRYKKVMGKRLRRMEKRNER